MVRTLAFVVLLSLATSPGEAASPVSNAAPPVSKAVKPADSPAKPVTATGPAGAAAPVIATLPEVASWEPLPLEVRRDVDAFFVNLELAINYNRIDLVMALYTPDAVEMKSDGARLDFAGIRQRRQAELDSVTRAGTKPATVQRNFLLYKRGDSDAEFKVQYPVHALGPSSGMHASIDNIIYTFRRNPSGVQLSSMVFNMLGGTNQSGPVPSLPVHPAHDPDGPVPKEIRLTNGVKLRQVKVLNWQRDVLLIQYVGGTVPVRLANIHPDDRAYFTANMDQALQKQKDEAVETARANEVRSRAEEAFAQQQAAMIAQQEEFKAAREAQLEEAIAHHQLVVGMTMDQVRRSWGSPSYIDQMETRMGHTVVWTYGGRGEDEHKAVIDATVAFVDEHVRVLLNLRAKDKG